MARPAIGARTCYRHGGRTRTGLAHPSLTAGRYSRSLPVRLAARYEESLQDPDLLSLRDEVAALDARIHEVMQGLDTGESGGIWRDLRDAHGRGESATVSVLIERGATEAEAWSELLTLLEQRRRLVESERKRLVELHQVLTIDQAMDMLARVVLAVREHVTDRTALAGIQLALDAVTRQTAGLPVSGVVEGEVVGEDRGAQHP